MNLSVTSAIDEEKWDIRKGGNNQPQKVIHKVEQILKAIVCNINLTLLIKKKKNLTLIYQAKTLLLFVFVLFQVLLLVKLLNEKATSTYLKK